MKALGELVHVVSVLRGRVRLQYPLLCTHCPAFLPVLTRKDAEIYKAHKKLLCKCGGTLRTVVGAP